MKTAFLQRMVRRLFATTGLEMLTVEVAPPEDGADERRNSSEY